MRENNRPDATINSINYIVVPGEDGYKKSFLRAQYQSQDLPGGVQQFVSRPDIRPMFQTSWAEGSRWEKPLVSNVTLASYFTAQGLNVYSLPGDLYPVPDMISLATGEVHTNSVALAVSPTAVYYFEPQQASLGLKKWDGSTLTTLTSDFGNGASDVPIAMCYDTANVTVFALFDTGHVRKLTIDTAGGSVIDVGNVYPGSNIFMHNGRLMVYSGEKLYEITTPLATPASVVIFNDAMGKDYLANAVNNATDPVWPYVYGARLAVASAEGVYIVKNVEQEGLPTPFIYRVDRDQAGTDIGTPLTTLPPGTLALDIAVQLGSLVMATATDTPAIMQNDISAYGHSQTVFYHLSNGSLGTIGSALGQNPSETVYRFLGTDVTQLYVGGHSGVWVYDAVRGGLHPIIGNAMSTAGGTWASAVMSTYSSIQSILFRHNFTSPGLVLPIKKEGGNTDTRLLQSVYFDGNLPGELKSVVAVTLMTDGIVSGETWTVGLSADDAAYTSVAAFSTAGTKTLRKEFVTAREGYRFQYQIVYTATGDITNPSHVKGIIFWMIPGEVVTQWALRLDLTESLNFQNTRLSPDTLQANLETLGAELSLFPFVDRYRETATTHDARVQRVDIQKFSANEAYADVVLIEHNLDN